MACAISSAASRALPAGTTRFTRPICRAASASTCSPRNAISLARAIPTRRGKKYVPPLVMVRPTAASGKPKRAPSSATTRSHESASSHPAPTAYPCTAATKGLGHACSLRVTLWRRALYSRRAGTPIFPAAISAAIPSVSFRSAPAQNARSAPASTAARTSGSAATPSSAASRARHVGVSIAFSTLGLFNVRTITAPSFWTTSSFAIATTPGRPRRRGPAMPNVQHLTGNPRPLHIKRRSLETFEASSYAGS